MAVPDLAGELSSLPARRGSAWLPDHEYVRGWGVFGLPFDSGHVLALRMFPENDFAPYRTIWHRDPGGRWSIYVDGPRMDAACPRYYGAACAHTAFARIDVTWTGPADFEVRMDDPALEWSVSATETPLLRAMNAVSPLLPEWTWRRGSLLRARELLAGKVLGLGDLRLSGVMPSGHYGVLVPKRMYWIERSTARLAGQNLGRPADLDVCPRIGEVTLPARGVLAVGEAHWRILDPQEHARLRRVTSGDEA